MLPPVTTSSHRWQSGYDIRTVQELLGHADVATTMIHTHPDAPASEKLSFN
jgi:site-specific recombinase XerC